MPIWGWVCIGLVVGLVVVGGGLYLLFHRFVVRPYEREQNRLKEHGQDVVAWVLLANPSVYRSATPSSFEFAFVVFTTDDDPSDQHLAFLRDVATRLDGFEADENAPDAKKPAWALSTQRTVDDALRIPDRVTGGREVYFSTPSVKRPLLPENKLTRDYIHLRVIPSGPARGSSMIEYVDATPRSRERRR